MNKKGILGLVFLALSSSIYPNKSYAEEKKGIEYIVEICCFKQKANEAEAFAKKNLKGYDYKIDEKIINGEKVFYPSIKMLSELDKKMLKDEIKKKIKFGCIPATKDEYNEKKVRKMIDCFFNIKNSKEFLSYFDKFYSDLQSGKRIELQPTEKESRITGRKEYDGSFYNNMKLKEYIKERGWKYGVEEGDVGFEANYRHKEVYHGKETEFFSGKAIFVLRKIKDDWKIVGGTGF